MLSPEIERAIAEAGELFRRQFTVNSRPEAHEIAAAFRRAIYQGRPGRPLRREITKAISLLDTGKTRFQVYRELGKETQGERRRLDEGIRMRRERQERRRRGLHASNDLLPR